MMSVSGMSKFRTRLLLSAGAWVILSGASVAQSVPTSSIATDGSVGPAANLSGPNYVVSQGLGQTNVSGTTVLHSFSRFNLLTGESVNFTGSSTLTAIIARVTGGTRSDINGTITSSAPNASLYLLNPNGFLFGPNSVINVPGSLYVSTAQRLNFADQSFITMTASPVGSLSSAPIASFGFLSGDPVNGVGGGDIVITGNNQTFPDLTFVNGDVSFLAANISVTDRVIMANRNAASQLRLGAVGTSTGNVGLTGRVGISGGTLTLNSFMNLRGTPGELADVYLSGGAIQLQKGTNPNIVDNLVLYTANSGRTNLIDISGGSLLMQTPTIQGSTFGIARAVASNITNATPGQVTINLTGNLSMVRSYIWVSSWPGRAGDVTIRAANMSLDQSYINTMAGTYDGGTIRLDLSGNLSLTNSSRLVAHTPAGTSSLNYQNTYNPAAPGNAGSIIVNAGGQISLTNGSYMSVSSDVATGSATSGRAGSVTLNAASLLMTGSDISFGARGGQRAGGTLSITTTGNIDLTGTSTATNTNFNTTFATLDGRSGTGTGGTLTINAGGQINLTNASINVSNLSGGNGGIIAIRSSGLTASASGFSFGGNGGVFSSGTSANGSGGSMTLTTTGDVRFSGLGPNSGGVFQALDGSAYGATSMDGVSANGRGGNLLFNVGGNLSFFDTEMDMGGDTTGGNAIFNVGQTYTNRSSSLFNQGGNISITANRIDLLASGFMRLDVGGTINSGGQILLQAPLINIGMDGVAEPEDAAMLQGGAGTRIIVRANTLNLGAGALISSDVSTTPAEEVYRVKNSGSTELYANTLNMASGAIIESIAPEGRAGDITIGATVLNMSGGSVSTRGQSGGIIRVGVDEQMWLRGGSISSTIAQSANGTDGNVYIGVTLTEPQFASGACDTVCQAYWPFSTEWTPGTRSGIPTRYDYSAADLRAANAVGQVIFGFGGGPSPEQLALPSQEVADAETSSPPVYMSAFDRTPPTRCEIEDARRRGGNTFSLVARLSGIDLRGRLRPERYEGRGQDDQRVACVETPSAYGVRHTASVSEGRR